MVQGRKTRECMILQVGLPDDVLPFQRGLWNDTKKAFNLVVCEQISRTHIVIRFDGFVFIGILMGALVGFRKKMVDGYAVPVPLNSRCRDSSHHLVIMLNADLSLGGFSRVFGVRTSRS